MTLSLVAAAACVVVPLATASTTQESIVEDDVSLHANTDGTLATLAALGVTRVKLAVNWNSIAPNPASFHKPSFNATNPADYPAANWAYYDHVVTQARADGLQVAFMLTGPAPLWATGPGMPHTPNCPCGQWKPSAAAFGLFARAIGERYSGNYDPRTNTLSPGNAEDLPRVSWWSIWNEPNYGPDLAPQAIGDTIELSPGEYRGLLDAAWSGLSASGHSTATDTILLGETAPRGLDHPIGNFSGIKPLRFLRALYCVDANLRPLRGSAASLRDCPATAAGARAFRGQNPALFASSGYAVHPYEQGTPPDLPTYACGGSFCSNTVTLQSDPDYADFPEIPRLERTLDRLNAIYGSGTHFPIWNTEYGWWTNPPYNDRASLPPATAADYMNWAEYLSFSQSRIRSYDQYLLVDPVTKHFSSGLELPNGTPLAMFGAFRIPLYMPSTLATRPSLLTVWGEVRPEPGALTAAGSTGDAVGSPVRRPGADPVQRQGAWTVQDRADRHDQQPARLLPDPAGIHTQRLRATPVVAARQVGGPGQPYRRAHDQVRRAPRRRRRTPSPRPAGRGEPGSHSSAGGCRRPGCRRAGRPGVGAGRPGGVAVHRARRAPPRHDGEAAAREHDQDEHDHDRRRDE